jgi:lysozyme
MANNYTAKTARWMLTCACFVGGFEGLACTAYPDRLAHGLPTVCYGETEGVQLGDHYTKAECQEMLANKLPRYWSEISRCISVKTSDNEKVAYTSFSYNVGTGAFCKGSVARRLNDGDHTGACNALLAYDHASGKKVPGLTRRREAERQLCLTPDSGHADVSVARGGPDAPPVVIPQPPVAVRHPWWDLLYWLFGIE